MNSITLSARYGLNPSVEVCFVCGEDRGVVLFGASYKNESGHHTEAPHRICVSSEPCDECKKLMKQGVIMLEVPAGCAEGENPPRTGRMWILTDDAVKRMVTSPALLASILRARMTFIPEDVARSLGLPHNENQQEVSNATEENKVESGPGPAADQHTPDSGCDTARKRPARRRRTRPATRNRKPRIRLRVG